MNIEMHACDGTKMTARKYVYSKCAENDEDDDDNNKERLFS